MQLLRGAICAAAVAPTWALRPGHVEVANTDEVARKVFRSFADLVSVVEFPFEEARQPALPADGSASLIDLRGHNHQDAPPTDKAELEAKSQEVFNEMKVVCRDPPTDKQPITSKDTLAMLRKCVTGIKSYIDVTKMFQKKSYKANKRHKEEVDKVVAHLGELENYILAVNAFNKDHSKAKDDLLKLSEELESNISNLLLPKTTPTTPKREIPMGKSASENKEEKTAPPVKADEANTTTAGSLLQVADYDYGKDEYDSLEYDSSEDDWYDYGEEEYEWSDYGEDEYGDYEYDSYDYDSYEYGEEYGEYEYAEEYGEEYDEEYGDAYKNEHEGYELQQQNASNAAIVVT